MDLKVEFDDGNLRQWRWDEYRMFHRCPNGQHWITQFQTGEVIMKKFKPGVEDRRWFDEIGMRLWQSNDDWHSWWGKLCTPEGEPVKMAWLQRDGQQILVLDPHTGRAHGMRGDITSTHLKDLPHRVPKWLHNWGPALYWPGPKQRGVGASVAVSKPLGLTVEQRRHLETQKAAAEAWLVTSGYDRPFRPVGLKPTEMLGKTFMDLTESARTALASVDYQEEFDVKHYPYLIIKNCKPSMLAHDYNPVSRRNAEEILAAARTEEPAYPEGDAVDSTIR